jgi:hypothetical protein
METHGIVTGSNQDLNKNTHHNTQKYGANSLFAGYLISDTTKDMYQKPSYNLLSDDDNKYSLNLQGTQTKSTAKPLLHDANAITPVKKLLNAPSSPTTIANSTKLLQKFTSCARKKASSQTSNKLTSIMLPLGTKHAEEFNEAVKRLPKKVISQIREKLPLVTDDNIQKISGIRNNPQSILKENLTFFKDDDTRYVLLKAFKLEVISKQQFFTLMSLYHEIRTNEILDCLPLYNETADGVVINDENWKVVSDSLSSLDTYNNRPELEDTRDIKQGKYTNLDSTIKDLQDKMQYLDPLDRVIFTCKRKKPEMISTTTDHLGNALPLLELYDQIRIGARFPVFYSPNFITIPNFTLLNNVVENIFGEHATAANLVLGSSTPDDIRNGMKNNHRDIGVHFEDPKLPTVIHWGTAIYSVEITLHDISHLFICLHTAPSSHKLLTQTGAELHSLADDINQAIKDTLEKIRDIELPVDTPENINKSANSLFKLHNFLLYLKKIRISLNQHDFMVYDGNFSTIDENTSTLRGILATHIKDMTKAFVDHDPDHVRDFASPAYMKQICKIIGLQLEEQFNYLVANNLIENNKFKFARALFQATWYALGSIIQQASPISRDIFQSPSEFNKYNFIACLQAYLLENYPQLKQTEDTSIIETNNTDNTPLHDCITTISAEELQRQIDSGIQLNKKNNQGDTVLHMLTKIKPEDRNEHYFEIIDILINNGIDLNIQNNNGETALHCEIKNNGLSNLAKILINLDMNFTIRDNTNMTAMDYVLRHNIREYFIAGVIPEKSAILWTRAYAKWRT